MLNYWYPPPVSITPPSTLDGFGVVHGTTPFFWIIHSSHMAYQAYNNASLISSNIVAIRLVLACQTRFYRLVFAPFVREVIALRAA